MADFQVYVLCGRPELVADRETNVATAMTAMGYSQQTRMRLAPGDSLSFLSGEIVDAAGEDWDPNLKASDTCVVLAFKRE